VGLHITRDLAHRKLYVDQQRYTETLLTRFGYENANPVSTPSDPHVPLSYPPPNDSDTHVPNFPYQEIVGCLLYLATHSRPDIAHAVSVVAQYSTNFREIHCTAVKRILKYLRGTTDYALCYSSDSTAPNSLADIGFSQQVPTPLFSDNQSAIRLVQNPEFHKRTKHIDVVFHLIRELQERGDISVFYVPTKLQLADILTKALTPDTFHKLRLALNISKKVLHQVGDSSLR
jgi:hypothetical protein